MAYSKKFLSILKDMGYESREDVEAFLHPSFDTLEDISQYDGFADAAARLKKAIENDESIIVYGDYDADGVCSVAMLYDFLSRFTDKVSYFIPDRHRDGYGINLEQVEYLATNYYPDVIITVDCGITATEDIDVIQNELGIDVIVTDHHEPPADAPHCIVVDPKTNKDKDIFKEYSGAGVVFRLIELMSDRATAMEYLDICTISTIGDIVPLVGDNRTIASHGLAAIRNTKRLGLKLLLDSIIKRDAEVTSYDVSFKIVPRINSVGRLGDAAKVVDLFLSDDYFMMNTLVEEMNATNDERQKLTDEVENSALEIIEDIDISGKSAIVVAGENWDSGIIGIAASRLVGIFNRPTILLARDGDVYKGSCRSIEGVNLHAVLSSMSEIFETFGGHAMACGLSIKKENIGELETRLNEAVDIALTMDRHSRRIELTNGDITVQFAKELKLLEPFGQDNKEPRFVWRNKDARFSQIGATNHIKCRLDRDFEIVYFNALDKIEYLNQKSDKEYYVKIKYAIYNNYDYVQAIVNGVKIDVNDEFDDTTAIASYVKNILRGRDSIFEIEDFDDSILKDSNYGTLLVAFTTATFNRYKKMYGEYIFRTDVGKVEDMNPLNAIVLGLDTKSNLKNYRNIVFLDDIVHYNVVDYLLLNANARVFTTHNIDDIIRCINVPDHEMLGKIFVPMKRLIVNNVYPNDIDVLYNDLKVLIDVNYIDFCIAFNTFYDLKIIRINNNRHIVIDNTVSTKLDNSEYYKELLELIEDGSDN